MKRHLVSMVSPAARQSGVVLIIALIVLVAMTLAAIALVRSVDVATQIAGNLAFRQSGVQAADSGVEVARKWLMSQNANVLNGTTVVAGYFAAGFANSVKPVDKLDWDNATPVSEDAAGNTPKYVIDRMCDLSGDPMTTPNIHCFSAPTSASGNSNRVKEGGEFSCMGNLCTASNNPYYRITVRVSGPRNTVTYVQAVIY